MDDFELSGSFTDYCIVCDRAIAPVKEKEKDVVKAGKKKVAGGTIRVSQHFLCSFLFCFGARSQTEADW